jgi:hypothetical protein
MKNTQGGVAIQTGLTRTKHEQEKTVIEEKIRYRLYARKSTESEERQVLSIDSQIKEMLQLAEREGLDVAEIRRESHSAKSTGQRPVYNELLTDIRERKFGGYSIINFSKQTGLPCSIAFFAVSPTPSLSFT